MIQQVKMEKSKEEKKLRFLWVSFQDVLRTLRFKSREDLE